MKSFRRSCVVIAFILLPSVCAGWWIPPTASPSEDPVSNAPKPPAPTTKRPTRRPTKRPTPTPTIAPVTKPPTKNPTRNPTRNPTITPTNIPTKAPTTNMPTAPANFEQTMIPTYLQYPLPTGKPTNNFFFTPGPTTRPPRPSPTIPTIDTPFPTLRPTSKPTRTPTNTCSAMEASAAALLSQNCGCNREICSCQFVDSSQGILNQQGTCESECEYCAFGVCVIPTTGHGANVPASALSNSFGFRYSLGQEGSFSMTMHLDQNSNPINRCDATLTGYSCFCGFIPCDDGSFKPYVDCIVSDVDRHVADFCLPNYGIPTTQTSNPLFGLLVEENDICNNL